MEAESLDGKSYPVQLYSDISAGTAGGTIWVRNFVDNLLSRVGIWRQVYCGPMEQRKHTQLDIPQDSVAEFPAKRRECEPSPGRHDILCHVNGEHRSSLLSRLIC